jgi:hypothetical protein
MSIPIDMLTEEQAKAKLCPETFNLPNSGACCCASTCMAWRWNPRQPRDQDKRGYCGKYGRPE